MIHLSKFAQASSITHLCRSFCGHPILPKAYRTRNWLSTDHSNDHYCNIKQLSIPQPHASVPQSVNECQLWQFFGQRDSYKAYQTKKHCLLTRSTETSEINSLGKIGIQRMTLIGTQLPVMDGDETLQVRGYCLDCCLT